MLDVLVPEMHEVHGVTSNLRLMFMHLDQLGASRPGGGRMRCPWSIFHTDTVLHGGNATLASPRDTNAPLYSGEFLEGW